MIDRTILRLRAGLPVTDDDLAELREHIDSRFEAKRREERATNWAITACLIAIATAIIFKVTA